jgi:hypothetical protein
VKGRDGKKRRRKGRKSGEVQEKYAQSPSKDPKEVLDKIIGDDLQSMMEG